MYSPSTFRREALAQVGKPYILGAEAALTNDDPRAFDCSELVEWLFGRNGTPIGDLAAWQYNKTQPVAGSPRVGDLVFLRNNPARANGIGHVAVITAPLANGDWEIVEARGRAAGVVKTTLSYWRTRRYYAGIRRHAAFSLAADTLAVSVPSSAVAFRLGVANLAGYGRTLDGPALGAALKARLRCSVLVLTETTEVARYAIRDALGGRDRWKVEVAPGGTCCVMWDSAKWVYGPVRTADFGDRWHGAVAVPLTSRVNGRGLDVIGTHTRPGAVATDAEKDADIRAAFGLAGTWPVVVGGDFARNAPSRPSLFVRATDALDTMDKAGVQSVDDAYVRGLAVRGSSVVDPGALSDHLWRVVQLTIGAPADPTL